MAAVPWLRPSSASLGSQLLPGQRLLVHLLISQVGALSFSHQHVHHAGAFAPQQLIQAKLHLVGQALPGQEDSVKPPLLPKCTL